MTPRLLNADWNYWPEERSAAQIWASSAAIGFDAIELGVYEPAVQLSEERVAMYQALAAEHALPVATILYSMPPERWPDGGLGAPAQAPLAIDAAIETARVANEAFGCTVLGIWPGADTLDRSTRPAEVWPVMVRSFRAIADNVAELGMEVAVEYKPNEMLANADAALRLCDAVDSPALGVLLDTGHALWVGEDLPIVVRLIGERLKHLHVGDTPGPVEADLPPGWHHDFTAFMAALEEIGYQRAMSLDMYGAVDEGVIGAQAASQYGYDTMVAATARARAAR
ncbi:MAG: sugar phosphate isomerase/epimerase family protein [Chloroflexota bacterium]